MVIKVYADGADLEAMRAVAKNPVVRGFTTNPTLLRKAGVKDYRAFAADVVRAFPKYPVSFEVFADDADGMLHQARKITAWGEHVYVKIPVVNSRGESTAAVIAALAAEEIKLNVTAVMTMAQVDEVLAALSDAPAVVSIFAGRIADTGRDPVPTFRHALARRRFGHHEILWASPRQVMDVYAASNCRCDIITCTPELIAKLSLEGKDLTQYSQETAKMFYDDAQAAGYKL